MRECKLRSGGNQLGKLKQKGVKRKGVKAGLGVQVKFLQAELECDRCSVIIIIIIIQYVCLLSQAFLPGTSLEPAVMPTVQASSFTLQYFPYYV